ncbi:MAG: serine/threonine-protein kinase [Anaerolineaceae bacterium]|nr:serine/threonine-protein kinase [Anaerolineaceae bacterium]
MANYEGFSIGRYHILEQIGIGGMAVVYKAFDTRLECDVAVKFIRMERLTPEIAEKALKRFEREAKAVAQLTHPFIVKVTDYGEFRGVPYLVMPYLPGGTLKQYTGNPMTYSPAARLLLPIAHALEYAHSQNVLHRDVKPSNILITQDRQPMLTDFGVAKLLELEDGQTLTGTGVGIGTPEYMAPEQVLGYAIDGRADVYALGMVFYELLTGRRPFVADTPMAVAMKQVTEPLPRPRSLIHDLPEAVEQVLFKALAKKPEDRFASMHAFAQALEKLTTPVFTSTAKNVSTPVSPAPSPKKKPTTPTRWVAWGIGATLLAALSIFLFFNPLQNNPQNTPAATLTAISNAATAQATLTSGQAEPKESRLIRTARTDSVDDFNDPGSTGWNEPANVTIKDGILTSTGSSNGYTVRQEEINRRESAVVQFKYSAGSEFTIALVSDDPNASDYELWGIHGTPGNNMAPAIRSGQALDSEPQVIGDLKPMDGAWYNLWLYVGDVDNDFSMFLWEKDEPARYLEIRQKAPDSWFDQTWHFAIATSQGDVKLDRYEKLSQYTSIGTSLHIGVIEDFNNPSSDGSLDSQMWKLQELPPECIVGQQDQSIFFDFLKPTNVFTACALSIDHSRDVLLPYLRSIEAKFNVSKTNNGKEIGIGVDFSSSDLPGKSWSSYCGIKTSEEKGIYAVFDMTNSGMNYPPDVQSSRMGLEYNHWYTFKQVFDPDTMSFTCYVGNALLGYATPSYLDQAEWAHFSAKIESYRTEDAYGMLLADDIRLLP